MTFNKLHKLLLETSFADLPDSLSKHYGFWISPNGDVELVPNGTDHAVIAKRMILKTPYLKSKFVESLRLQGFDESKMNEIYYMTFKDYLYENLKYMRVVVERHRSLYSSTVVLPTNKQQQTIQDLGMLYDMEVMKNEIEN